LVLACEEGVVDFTNIYQSTHTFNTDSVLNVKAVLTCRPLSLDLLVCGEGVGGCQVDKLENLHILYRLCIEC